MKTWSSESSATAPQRLDVTRARPQRRPARRGGRVLRIGEEAQHPAGTRRGEVHQTGVGHHRRARARRSGRARPRSGRGTDAREHRRGRARPAPMRRLPGRSDCPRLRASTSARSAARIRRAAAASSGSPGRRSAVSSRAAHRAPARRSARPRFGCAASHCAANAAETGGSSKRGTGGHRRRIETQGRQQRQHAHRLVAGDRRRQRIGEPRDRNRKDRGRRRRRGVHRRRVRARSRDAIRRRPSPAPSRSAGDAGAAAVEAARPGRPGRRRRPALARGYVQVRAKRRVAARDPRVVVVGEQVDLGLRCDRRRGARAPASSAADRRACRA